MCSIDAIGRPPFMGTQDFIRQGSRMGTSKHASVLCFSGVALCSQDLRMGEEELTKAAQLCGKLWDEQTCWELDDDERESLYEPFLFVVHTVEDMWKY